MKRMTNIIHMTAVIILLIGIACAAIGAGIMDAGGEMAEAMRFMKAGIAVTIMALILSNI